VPWFLVGFLAVAILNSTGIIAPGLRAFLVQASIFLIATALAGIGLSTDVAGLRRAGWRPLLLGAILWILVACTSLAVIRLTGGLG
ncbi:MAG TPA: putative sulfate exporter family transporter, partial [Microbacteriaceae bacterium]|nr:putative sulfate exporter family transporter [Microbacteriaceae bacterium]